MRTPLRVITLSACVDLHFLAYDCSVRLALVTQWREKLQILRHLFLSLTNPMLRWLTHLCTWNPVPGVVVAAAGRSPAWQLGPGLRGTKENKKKRSQYYPRGASCLSSRVPDLLHHHAFSGRGWPLRDIKATRVALIPRRGHPPCLDPLAGQSIGRLQWPSGRHHPDKGERHR